MEKGERGVKNSYVRMCVRASLLARSTPARSGVSSQQHVGRLHVGVNQACRVKGREAVREGFDEPARGLRICSSPRPLGASVEPGQQGEVEQWEDQLDAVEPDADIL